MKIDRNVPKLLRGNRHSITALNKWSMLKTEVRLITAHMRHFFKPSSPALGPTRPPIWWVPGFFPGVKQPRRDSDYSPPSSAEVTPPCTFMAWTGKVKIKGKVNPRTHHEGQNGEQSNSYTLPLTSAPNGGGWLRPRSDRFTPGKEFRYPLYRRLGGPHSKSVNVRKISPLPGLEPGPSSRVAIPTTPSRPTHGMDRDKFTFFTKSTAWNANIIAVSNEKNMWKVRSVCKCGGNKELQIHQIMLAWANFRRK